MKLLSDISKSSLPAKSEGKLVDSIAVLGGWRILEQPTLSTELECTICQGKEHYTPFVDPSTDKRRVWICANGLCVTNINKFYPKATTIPPTLKRAIAWPLFCEINGIGNVHHHVRFEDVDQSHAKKSYMLKFANNPSGIIFMQGEPGTGKTYAAMAICEFFTRKDTSCIFTSQKKMLIDWLETFKNERSTSINYIDKITKQTLLVIDDFGTSEVTPGFMSFFMDLINNRMQWTNRGTIVTSNLCNQKFGDYCGDALFDRINTGQKFEFKGKTRRIKNIL